MPESQHPEVFRTVLESVQTGVCIAERELRIVFWNDGAEKIRGYLQQEIVARFAAAN